MKKSTSPAICSVEECERPRKARGLCGMHYQRLQNTGTTDLPTVPHPDDIPEEIWLPVAGFEGFYEVSDHGRVYSVPRSKTPGGLLKPWIEETGRAQISLVRPGARRTNRYVHQLVMEAFVGPAPVGLEVCHGKSGVSDNRLSNLRYDTHAENMRDMLRDGTHHNANKTGCPQSHQYTAENTYSPPGSPRGRFCRQCETERGAARAAARRDAA